MRRFVFAATLVVASLIPAAMPAAAQVPYRDDAQRALQWLQCAQQQPNGQIGSGGNPIARSAEVALGLAAAGQPAAAMKSGAHSLADYLTSVVTTDVGSNGELLLARASQSDTGPTATVAALLQASKSASGSTAGEYGSDIFSDALAILGLRAAGQPVGPDAVAFLKAQQKSDGGWSFDNADRYGTDSNTTSLVIQSLISSGVAANDPAIANGFRYLDGVFGQGGFGNGPGAGPDPNSDELAIQAILAANRQETEAARLDQALGYLASQQVASGTDVGAIASSFSKLFATSGAPAVFLLRPLTQAGRASSALALLPCPVAAPAPSSAPTPAAPAPPARLPQTGGPQVGQHLALGLVILGLGLGIVRRSWRRAPDR